MGTAATAAASGRSSPLTVLSSSLPSSTSHANDRLGQRDGDGDERGDGVWEEVEEGDTMRLSTLDAFRRQLDEAADEEDSGYGSRSEDEGERARCMGESTDERRVRTSGDKKEREEGEDSDGEVGIGLSLMGELGSGDDEDEGREDGAELVKTTNGNGGASDVGTGNASSVSGQNGGTTAMAWTRYTPSSPVSPQDLNEYRRTGEEEGGGGDEEEDEDDGGYWDDIYDDYRYSRHSLASKRASVTSKASGASKASSKARANAPPMPRPSISSDGTNGCPRPSLESASSSVSFKRPSLTRSGSDESTHETHMLPLTSQFPAVPVHVPVRTESRLRIVHDGYMQGGDDHGERELQVEHASTEDDTGQVGLNIEVVEVADEDGAQGQEADAGRTLTSLNTSAALSPLLHTTFGSPHSSRFTDVEEGSDQDHWRRHSNKSGKSAISSAEGPPKSPTDGGGIASVLRAKMEAERTPSSGTTPSLVVCNPDPSPDEEPDARAIVVDDEEGHVTGINTTVNDPILETKTVSPLTTLSTQTPNTSQVTTPTDPAQGTPPADQPDGAEKSPFLGQRSHPSRSSHPFARTSMFLPHPNAPKAVHQSQGPMYGRTAPQPYAYPGPPGPGSGNMTHSPGQQPGTTFYSTQILHQLRSVFIAASQGPTRRPPMTLFARCESDLSGSMGPVPIQFSLDPFPPLRMMPAGPQTRVGSGKGAHHPANMTPTRAATVSAPARRGGGDGIPPNEVGLGAGDSSSLRLPRRSATAVANVGGPQGIDAGWRCSSAVEVIL
ncbi:hypothetical protein HD554DRAFT_839467 [Boletus coccyginus]|nr:hypothetical protein HD554DRAFT_839467 [Boletus coccyginus]